MLRNGHGEFWQLQKIDTFAGDYKANFRLSCVGVCGFWFIAWSQQFFTLELNQFFFTETNGKKTLGGCATVAGWGHRYSLDGSEATHDGESSCMTDFSDASVDKVK